MVEVNSVTDEEDSLVGDSDLEDESSDAHPQPDRDVI